MNRNFDTKNYKKVKLNRDVVYNANVLIFGPLNYQQIKHNQKEKVRQKRVITKLRFN